MPAISAVRTSQIVTKKFLQNKASPSCNPKLTKTLTNYNPYPRMLMIATKKSSPSNTKDHQSFLLLPLKLKTRRQPVSDPTLRSLMVMISSDRFKKRQERKRSKRNKCGRTSRTKTIIGQVDLSQTNMITATARRDHPRRALQSTCIKRKWPCPPCPVLANLIQLERSLLGRNRFESDYFGYNCGFIESTIIGFRLTYVWNFNLLLAPPKYEILILNG